MEIFVFLEILPSAVVRPLFFPGLGSRIIYKQLMAPDFSQAAPAPGIFFKLLQLQNMRLRLPSPNFFSTFLWLPFSGRTNYTQYFFARLPVRV